jgi:hypothetical protein
MEKLFRPNPRHWFKKEKAADDCGLYMITSSFAGL